MVSRPFWDLDRSASVDFVLLVDLYDAALDRNRFSRDFFSLEDVGSRAGDAAFVTAWIAFGVVMLTISLPCRVSVPDDEASDPGPAISRPQDSVT